MRRPGSRRRTPRRRGGVLDRNLLPYLGKVPLSKLGAADLDRLYRRLRTAGGKGGRPLAPATIRRTHGVLHRALGQGVRWGWLSVNPASSATPPSVPAPDINPPAPHEPAKLFGLATESEIELADFILLAATTGARRSELVALRWTDLDLERATVLIRRGIVTGFTGLVEKDTKNHAARRVSLDPTTTAALAARRARAVEGARMCEHELDAGAFVFSNEVDGSKSWYPDSVSRAVARLCCKAGIKGGGLHGSQNASGASQVKSPRRSSQVTVVASVTVPPTPIRSVSAEARSMPARSATQLPKRL